MLSFMYYGATLKVSANIEDKKILMKNKNANLIIMHFQVYFEMLRKSTASQISLGCYQLNLHQLLAPII